jgi:hypothetical protein
MIGETSYGLRWAGPDRDKEITLYHEVSSVRHCLALSEEDLLEMVAAFDIYYEERGGE